MNWINLTKIGADYGPVILIVVAVIVVIWLIWKVYPAVAGFVAIINLIKSIPGRFQKVDESMEHLKESGERKDAVLADIKSTVDKQGTAIEDTVKTLANHIEWGNKENALIRKHVETSDRQQAEWERIQTSWYDMQSKVNLLLQATAKIDTKQDAVVHEVKHNGGSSMKDAIVRAERAVVLNDERLDRIEKLLSDVLGVRGDD